MRSFCLDLRLLGFDQQLTFRGLNINYGVVILLLCLVDVSRETSLLPCRRLVGVALRGLRRLLLFRPQRFRTPSRTSIGPGLGFAPTFVERLVTPLNTHDSAAGISFSEIDRGADNQQKSELELAELVERVFGSREHLARKYHRWLAEEATVRGLIGPREAPKLWDRHIINSAAVGEAIGKGLTVADIGSGAGLPGIPLALARPDLDVVLIEPLLRRTTFLQEVVEDLDLNNVRVIRGRAEDKNVRASVGQVDVATSRAVAPLGKLAGWSLPLVKSGGVMVALKGSTAQDEVNRDIKVITKAKGVNPKVIRVGSTLTDNPTYVVIVRKK